MVVLPRPQLHLLVVVAVTGEHLWPGLMGGGPNRRERGQQQRLVAVGRNHERGTDRGLARLVEGVHEPQRGTDLLDQVVEGRPFGRHLLERFELAADLPLGVLALGGDGVQGAFELPIEAVDERRDPLLVLVQAVLVVGVQDRSAERRSERRHQQEHGHPEHALGQETLPPAEAGSGSAAGQHVRARHRGGV